MGVSVRRQGPKVSISLRLSLIHDEHEKIEVWSSIIDVVEVNCCLSLNPIFAVLIHLSDSRRRSCSTTVGRSALRRAGMDSFGSPVARPARTDDEDDDDDDDDDDEEEYYEDDEEEEEEEEEDDTTEDEDKSRDGVFLS